MKKKQIFIIALFVIVITYLSLYFQWSEFYEGYSFNYFNLFVSIIFLLAWLLFSFYWGTIQEKNYKKFIIVYWGINIVASIFIWVFANNKFIQSFLFPFYVWYGGPLYGFRDMLFFVNRLTIDVPSLVLITSPLGILFSFIGYRVGYRLSKIACGKKSGG